MTWPTTTTTDSVDNAYDAPQNARADIKRNIDNVNAIIAEFGTVDLGTPQDGQILAYDGTDWSVTNNTLLNGSYMRVINPGGNTQYPISWSASPSATITQTFDFMPDYNFDDQNIFNLSSGDDNPEIPAGTYQIQIDGYWSIQIQRTTGNVPSYGVSVTIELLNTDTSTVLATFTPSQTHDISTDSNRTHRLMWCDLTTTETFASATNIQVKATATITSLSSATGLGFIGGGFMARFIKTA